MAIDEFVIVLLLSFSADNVELGFDQVIKMEMEPRNAENENLNEERNKEASQCCSWCHKLHTTVSKWMLPEDIRSRYMERANCLPPPLFIVSISLAEVESALMATCNLELINVT